MADSADRSTFERTLLPHLDAAYNLARWMLRDHADAQDVVQESTMRALRYFSTLRGQDPLPWLLQIVRNTAYSMLERRRAKTTQPLADDTPLVDTSIPDPSAELSTRMDAQMLHRAVDALPDDFREVIVLRELEGLSYKQISVVTGVSIGTVMSRISRARKRLQEALSTRASEEAEHGM